MEVISSRFPRAHHVASWPPASSSLRRHTTRTHHLNGKLVQARTTKGPRKQLTSAKGSEWCTGTAAAASTERVARCGLCVAFIAGARDEALDCWTGKPHLCPSRRKMSSLVQMKNPKLRPHFELRLAAWPSSGLDTARDHASIPSSTSRGCRAKCLSASLVFLTAGLNAERTSALQE